MDGRSAARLAFTAAAGHRAHVRELERRLNWWQRWIVRWAFRGNRIAGLLIMERGHARAMYRWGTAVDDQCERDELVPVLRFDDVTPVIPMRKFLKG